MQYFILEHPTRGCVTDLPGDRDEKYHFSWSGPRNDERVVKFFDIYTARLHRDAANHQVASRNARVEIRDSLRRWEVVS